MNAGQVRRSNALLASWVAADLLSILGTRLAALAVPWLVLTTTGSATRTGIVAAAELAPMVLSRALSGPLIDRLGAVRCAVLADLVSAVSVALIPLLWTAHVLSFPALNAAVAVLGAARGPGDSAKQTMLPVLATATGHPLERVTGIGGTTERLASSVGLALGGVVVAAVGGAQALTVTALGFAVSAVLTVVVLRPALAPHQPPRPPGQGYLTELNEGFTGLRRDPVLVAIVIMIALTNAIDQAYVAVLLPTWVIATAHGAQTLGWLLAAFMVAAVLGAVVATALASRLPRLPVYLAAFLLCGAPRFLVLVLDVPLPGVLATMAVTGFGAGFVNPILSAVILERAPIAVRGRVVSLIGAASIALTPFGGLLGGLLIDHAGLVATLVAAGVAYFAVTMLPATVPAFRDFGRRPERTATSWGAAQNSSSAELATVLHVCPAPCLPTACRMAVPQLVPPDGPLAETGAPSRRSAGVLQSDVPLRPDERGQISRDLTQLLPCFQHHGRLHRP